MLLKFHSVAAAAFSIAVFAGGAAQADVVTVTGGTGLPSATS